MNCKNFLTHGTNCQYQGIKLRWIMLAASAAWVGIFFIVAHIARQVTL